MDCRSLTIISRHCNARLAVALLISTTFFSAAAPGAPPSYTLTPLRLPASTTPVCGASDLFTPEATGINKAREVTGAYCRRVAGGSPQESVRGFRWRPGKGIVDLGVPAGFPDDPTTVVQPSGINARGDIAGQVQGDGSRPSAFLWNGSRMTVIVIQAIATAINDPGQIAGILIKPAGNGTFLYSHGKVTDLGTLPGAIDTAAYAMSNRGHIAGKADIPAGSGFYSPLVLWTGASWKNLGTLAGDVLAQPFGMNAFDEIVGVSDDGKGGSRPFLWDGSMIALPCVPGTSCEPGAINDAGTIVGASNSSALVWIRGAVYDLNMLIDPRDPLNGQVDLFSASSINNRGDIVANGQYHSGPKLDQFDGFLLTPDAEE
jgi:uncharacterized membrane protein